MSMSMLSMGKGCCWAVYLDGHDDIEIALVCVGSLAEGVEGIPPQK